MNVVVLYRPNSEHERAVLDFEHNFTHQTEKDIDLVSLDTIEGDEMARMYDVTQYPAVIARDSEGKLLKLWQGGTLPLINEVSYYAQERSFN